MSDTPGAEVSDTPEAEVSDTPGAEVSDTAGAEVSGTLEAEVSDTPGAEVSHPWSRTTSDFLRVLPPPCLFKSDNWTIKSEGFYSNRKFLSTLRFQIVRSDR